MASKQQTRANRKNARRSTGPRTAAGKAKSSNNALKHGLRAQATVLPDENLNEFEFLVSELEDQFQPQSAIEWNLLRQLADAEWRMRRVPGLEAAMFAAKLHETARYYHSYPERLPEDEAEAEMVLIGQAAESDARNGDTFSKLSRYEARLSHRYFKALEYLQKLQSTRRQAAAPGNQPPDVPAPAGGASGADRETNGAGRADGNAHRILSARPSGFRSTAPTIDAPSSQPAPNSARPTIAKGDPSPVRKGRVHTGKEAPDRRQSPPPVPKAALLKTQPAPKPTANQKDRAFSRPQCRARPKCAKRTQFPHEASTRKSNPWGSSDRGFPFPGRAVPQTDTRNLRRRRFLSPLL